jgi:peptide/nickel transport system ATP-binding protein
VLKLVADPPGRIMGGSILFRGANLLYGLEREARFKPVKHTNRVTVKRRFRAIARGQERMSAVRGAGISMIFQEPISAMNPIFSIADQLSEALLIHRGTEILDGLLQSGPHRSTHELQANRAAQEKLQQDLQKLAPSDSSRRELEARRATLTAEAQTIGQRQATYGPAVASAVEELLRVAQDYDRSRLRAAAQRLGEAAKLPSLGVQAYYALLESHSDQEHRRALLHKALRRLHLSALQRRFLDTELHRMRLLAELRKVYRREMTEQKLQSGARRRIQARLLSLRLASLPFSLWGIRGHVRKPLKEETFWRSVRLLEGVSIANPVQVARGYPHELSGGMIQRVMISMALSSDPALLIADEPTTALDVTIQAQILDLMRDLKSRIGTSIMLITHDLGVIAEAADRVCVMYAGNVAEIAPVRELFRRPLHPYTQGLLSSIPRMDDPTKRLESIPGSVPNLIYPPSGCRFHPRCPFAMPICKEARPPMTVEGEGHTVACYLYHGPVSTE